MFLNRVELLAFAFALTTTNCAGDGESGLSQADTADTILDSGASELDGHQDVDEQDSTDLTTDATLADDAFAPPIGPRCNRDADCTAGNARTCDPLYKVCVECIVGTSCGGDAWCKHYQCTPLERPAPSCVHDSDCANGDGFGACKPVEHYCVECYEDWQCPNPVNVQCLGFECQPRSGCDTSLDCPLGNLCYRGGCVECLTNSECSAPLTCESHQCVSPREPSGPVYPERPVAPTFDACTTDLQCTPKNQLCSRSTGRCADCITRDQCHDPNRPACADPGFCVECTTSSDCPAPYICRNLQCVAPECNVGDGLCAQRCRDEHHCPYFQAGAAGYLGDGLYRCEDGSFSAVLRACPRQACSQVDWTASCAAWELPSTCDADSLGCLSAYERLDCQQGSSNAEYSVEYCPCSPASGRCYHP